MNRPRRGGRTSLDDIAGRERTHDKEKTETICKKDGKSSASREEEESRKKVSGETTWIENSTEGEIKNAGEQAADCGKDGNDE